LEGAGWGDARPANKNPPPADMATARNFLAGVAVARTLLVGASGLPHRCNRGLPRTLAHDLFPLNILPPQKNTDARPQAVSRTVDCLGAAPSSRHGYGLKSQGGSGIDQPSARPEIDGQGAPLRVVALGWLWASRLLKKTAVGNAFRNTGARPGDNPWSGQRPAPAADAGIAPPSPPCKPRLVQERPLAM